MPITTTEFENFADFSRAKLEVQAHDFTLDDLVIEWESLQNRGDVNAAIREGLDDAKAGRHRAADEVMADLLKKHNISTK